MCPLKILPVEKIRELDSYTISNEPVDSINLMERAAAKCYEWITGNALNINSFKVICGMGNNGGDGLAIARMLHFAGYSVEIYYIRHAAEASNDNKVNFKRAANIPGLIVTEVFEDDTSIDISEGEVVIDALLGSGLNKPVTGFLADVIKQVNNSSAYVISIDIPSGLMADLPTVESKKSAIINADYTLTFQMPKLAFFMPENDKYTGKLVVLDIGLSTEFINDTGSSFHLTQESDCRKIYKPLQRFAHKGTYGHALLIAGSLGKIGASIMASKACLRSGAGLITAHTPWCGMDAIHSSVPEVMVNLDKSETHFSSLPDLSPYNAIAIGPGIGMHPETQNALKLLIQEAKSPLIIDADGLNILAENKTWLSFLPPGTILTPHLKEFERITSPTDNHFNRLEILMAFTQRFKVYVVLKGAFSAIGFPDGTVYFNPTGNPGMATGGTGDVLTGIILGLKATGYSSGEACILGTWLHGKAADIAAKKISQPALIATDVIGYLGKAFLKLG